MGTYKDEKGTTRVGDFLRGLGNVGKPILTAAGNLTGQKWLSDIAAQITTSKDLTEDQKNTALMFLKYDSEDRQNARKLQSDALAQDDLFSKRFIYYLTIFWSIIAGAFIMVILFHRIPEENTRLIDTILGFLLGTIIASIITYFFGSSAGSEKKNGLFNLIKKES